MLGHVLSFGYRAEEAVTATDDQSSSNYFYYSLLSTSPNDLNLALAMTHRQFDRDEHFERND